MKDVLGESMSDNNKIVDDYVSEVDKFLKTYDKEHPELSKSQMKEVTKYQRIYHLRDGESVETEQKPLWEGF